MQRVSINLSVFSAPGSRPAHIGTTAKTPARHKQHTATAKIIIHSCHPASRRGLHSPANECWHETLALKRTCSSILPTAKIIIHSASRRGLHSPANERWHETPALKRTCSSILPTAKIIIHSASRRGLHSPANECWHETPALKRTCSSILPLPK